MQNLDRDMPTGNCHVEFGLSHQFKQGSSVPSCFLRLKDLLYGISLIEALVLLIEGVPLIFADDKLLSLYRLDPELNISCL